MAVAPKAKKAQSRKQVAAHHAAGLKWAAAGRASQAASRKASPVFAHHKSSQAARKAAKTRAKNKARKAGIKSVKFAAVAPAEAVPGSLWTLGCNDVAPTCAAAAVANHLLWRTGRAMTDREVAWLHRAAGGDSGAAIADVLEYLRDSVMPLESGSVKLGSFCRTDEEVIVAGLIVGVKLPHARHAVVSVPGGMVSWGQVLPWAVGEPEEAWALE